jgi:iron complex transport system ATP-binding protein
LRSINRERGTTVVVVLHDLALASAVADRVAVFVRGRLYAAGAPHDLLTSETLADVFAVEARLCFQPAGRARLEVLGPLDPTRNL